MTRSIDLLRRDEREQWPAHTSLLQPCPRPRVEEDNGAPYRTLGGCGRRF